MGWEFKLGKKSTRKNQRVGGKAAKREKMKRKLVRGQGREGKHKRGQSENILQN